MIVWGKPAMGKCRIVAYVGIHAMPFIDMYEPILLGPAPRKRAKKNKQMKDWQ